MPRQKWPMSSELIGGGCSNWYVCIYIYGCKRENHYPFEFGDSLAVFGTWLDSFGGIIRNVSEQLRTINIRNKQQNTRIISILYYIYKYIYIYLDIFGIYIYYNYHYKQHHIILHIANNYYWEIIAKQRWPQMLSPDFRGDLWNPFWTWKTRMLRRALQRSYYMGVSIEKMGAPTWMV